MIRNKALPIRDLLMHYLRQEGLETPLMEYRIIQAWPKVAGEVVSKYTKETYIRNSMLYVRLSSAALKQNLMMMHKEYAQKLNAYVGTQVITDVNFL